MFFVEIVTNNMDPFIAQITADCFMPLATAFLHMPHVNLAIVIVMV